MIGDFANLLVESANASVRLLLMWSWQAFLLLGFVWLVLKVSRSRTPAIRHQLWLYGVIAVALWPLWTSITHKFPVPKPNYRFLTSVAEIPATVTAPSSPTPVRQATGPVSISTNPVETRLIRTAPLDWSPWVWTLLFVAWLTGALITLTRLCISFWKLQGIQMKAQLVNATELGCTDVYLRAMNAARVRIGLSSDIHSPVLAGLLRPMILLPFDIASWTTVEERVSILQHELAHVERRDHYINFFQSLLRSVLFFHPMFRYACHQLNLERELACDARVLHSGSMPAAYADSILKVVERNIFPDAVHQPASFASRRKLERRIDMILRKENLPVLTRHWPFLVLPTGLILALVWLITPGRPVTADPGEGRTTAGAIAQNITEDPIQLLGEAKAFDKLIEIVQSSPNPELRRRALERLSELEGDGSTGALLSLYDQIQDSALKRDLIRYLGERKAFDKLIEIVQFDPDTELRLQAARRLLELEGDGSIAALVSLYNRSQDVSLKEMIINSLGERSEYQELKKLSISDPNPALRQAALKQLAEIERRSDSRDR